MRSFASNGFLLLIFVWPVVSQEATIQLTESNAKSTLESARLTFVNFYVDWCRYSQDLAPIVDEVARKLKAEFPDNKDLIVAKVDCQVEVALAKEFAIGKYPTMKVFRYGHLQHREYRGQRSADAIAEFIRSLLSQQPVRTLEAPVAPNELPLERTEGALVGRFASNDTEAWRAFQRVAEQLGEDCAFVAVVGSTAEPDSVVYQKGTDSQSQIRLEYLDAAAMKRLVQDRCTTIVREMTFENAEGITEEGNPLFLLFYRAEEPEIVEKFKDTVEKHMKQYANKITFVSAQGALFAKPIRQLGKSLDDLPIIAIDSFRHMYQFPHDVSDSLERYPSRLASFIEDLMSGKLHRDFHSAKGDSHDNPESKSTEPPRSVFSRLFPSSSRYSFGHEEL